MTDEDFAQRIALYHSDMQEIANTPAGVRFFAQLFREAGCLQSTHTKSADVYRLTGVQAFGLSIWKDLHASHPEASRTIFDALMTVHTEEDSSDG